MKARICKMLLGLWISTVTAVVHSQEPTDIRPDAVPFMRLKLAHTKEIVEGLALADFDGIARHAQKLSLLSLESNWHAIQSPEYAAASAEFRESVNRLEKAAQDKNLDGTTLAYFEVTLNCVRCHKYLRQVHK